MNTPKVSVLIRNLNEEKNLKILFPILNSQSYNNFDVIFLDSGSSDNSIEFVKNFKSKFKIIIDHIAKEEFSFGKALNLCANLAKNSEYIISLSAHCFPVSEHFIENYVKNFKETKSEIIYGKQTGYKNSLISEASHLENWFDNDFGIKKLNPFSNNGNCGYKYSVWRELKFNEKLTGCEDIEFAIRALKKGYNIAYCDEITVEHFHLENKHSIFIRYFREAMALNSIYEYKFTIFNFLRNLTIETLNDIIFKLKNKKFSNNKLTSIFIYRFYKQVGHYKGFKNQNFSNNYKIYYYDDFNDTVLKNNLFKKYLS